MESALSRGSRRQWITRAPGKEQGGEREMKEIERRLVADAQLPFGRAIAQRTQILVSELQAFRPVELERCLPRLIIRIGECLRRHAREGRQLAGAVQPRMRREDLLDKRRAGARQTDDEHRLVRSQPETATLGEKLRAVRSDDAIYPHGELLAIERPGFSAPRGVGERSCLCGIAVVAAPIMIFGDAVADEGLGLIFHGVVAERGARAIEPITFDFSFREAKAMPKRHGMPWPATEDVQIAAEYVICLAQVFQRAPEPEPALDMIRVQRQGLAEQ